MVQNAPRLCLGSNPKLPTSRGARHYVPARLPVRPIFGLGMLAMIIHAASDFNFHIPANAIYFSFLAGIFFFTQAADRE